MYRKDSTLYFFCRMTINCIVDDECAKVEVNYGRVRDACNNWRLYADIFGRLGQAVSYLNPSLPTPRFSGSIKYTRAAGRAAQRPWRRGFEGVSLTTQRRLTATEANWRCGGGLAAMERHRRLSTGLRLFCLTTTPGDGSGPAGER